MVRDADEIASFVLGVSRTMVKDRKRLEWRREKLREAFMVPDMVEAPVGDATLDVDCLETCLAWLAERERMAGTCSTTHRRRHPRDNPVPIHS